MLRSATRLRRGALPIRGPYSTWIAWIPDSAAQRKGRCTASGISHRIPPKWPSFGIAASRISRLKQSRKRVSGNLPSTVLTENPVPKGLAMLIRSDLYGVQGGAAMAAHTCAIPAASAPTLLIGGLLLLIGP
jgi:hypothetical protein